MALPDCAAHFPLKALHLRLVPNIHILLHIAVGSSAGTEKRMKTTRLFLFISATVGRSQYVDPFIIRFGTRPKPLPYPRFRSTSLLYWLCYSLSLNHSVYRSVRRLITSKRILTGSLIPSSSFFRINLWCAKITTFHYSFPKSIKEIAFRETWAPVRYYSNSRFNLWHINLVFLQ